MSNIKDRYGALRHGDDLLKPWTPDCTSFKKLTQIADVISACKNSGRTRIKSLTHYTANAFNDTTVYNIQASKYLFEKFSFDYILSAVFSQDPLEKFFGQARQRSGGNFYIDIFDVLAVTKMQTPLTP